MMIFSNKSTILVQLQPEKPENDVACLQVFKARQLRKISELVYSMGIR